jgi:hypothetical protein
MALQFSGVHFRMVARHSVRNAIEPGASILDIPRNIAGDIHVSDAFIKLYTCRNSSQEVADAPSFDHRVDASRKLMKQE